MGDVILYVDDLQSRVGIAHCRICHEAEFESCKSLEAPCACSGTVKFAHRDCIQRWCEEKGNTTCEICLQNYEPGYSAAPSTKSQSIEAMTIGDSLEILRGEYESENQELLEGSTVDTADSECASTADRNVSRCRSLALIFTVFLLLRHVFATLTTGTENYPFTLFTILILRASGIILPMYVVFRTIAAFQKGSRRQYFNQDRDDDDFEETSTSEEDENEQRHLS